MSYKKNKNSIDPEQREMIEKAQERAKQKKRLIQHFIFFLIGSVIFIILNAFLEYGKDIQPFGIDWFVWAIIIWGVILLLHAYNVFVTNRFLGKDWENRQIEKLVAKQRKKIDELQQKVEREHPLTKNTGTNTTTPTSPKPGIDPDKPINS
ncbi:2TM domain-containing protein [Salinimicrobium sp. GXAS 041]|uniref:2TM domain-containing protein n=1 Tax=Salinimicrobium sp. GXAS 041 TaxID=3400806 RepID=UPI003C789DF4